MMEDNRKRKRRRGEGAGFLMVAKSMGSEENGERRFQTDLGKQREEKSVGGSIGRYGSFRLKVREMSF